VRLQEIEDSLKADRPTGGTTTPLDGHRQDTGWWAATPMACRTTTQHDSGDGPQSASPFCYTTPPTDGTNGSIVGVNSKIESAPRRKAHPALALARATSPCDGYLLDFEIMHRCGGGIISALLDVDPLGGLKSGSLPAAEGSGRT
jgi:hypothetical protein